MTLKPEKTTKQRASTIAKQQRGRRKTPKTFEIALSNNWTVQNSWDFGEEWVSGISNSYRDYDNIRIKDKQGTEVLLQYKEYDKFIEIYSIDAHPKGTGMGSKVMKTIRDYADSKNKGVLATKVKNKAWARRTKMTKRNPMINGRTLEYHMGYTEYVYGDVPKDAIDYSWVLEDPEE